MFTKPFQEISKKDTLIAGGKGASLGEMTQAGIPVPPGFVVLTDAFDQFLAETDLTQEIQSELSKVDQDAIHTVEHASERIQHMILSAEMPEDVASVVMESFKELGAEFVAVRSSATAEDSDSAAWAGQLDSFLNTTEGSLLKNVQKCWASLFTPRAIFYRFEKGLHESHVSVAVVVQKMVNSESSGIAFSVHPVTEDPNQLIIEAGLGLGEAIVSGSVTPDSYVVDKKDRTIIDVNVNEQKKALYRSCHPDRSGARLPMRLGISGNEWKDLGEEGAKQVLSEDEILELSELIIKIENHYGTPQDIEWAREACPPDSVEQCGRDGKFYITQSRPITTLNLGKGSDMEGDRSDSELDIDVEQITSLSWSKRWEAPLSLFVIYTGVGGYFEPMKEEMGYSFSKVLIDSKDGTSGCYLLDDDMDDFAKVLSDKISKNETVISEWAQKFKDRGDRLTALYKNDSEWFLDKDNYEHFINVLNSYGVYLVVVTQVVDRLSADQYEKYGPELESARKYTERILFDIEEVVNNFLELIAIKENYNLKNVNCCSVEEVYNYLAGDLLPDEVDLEKRNVRSAVYYSPKPRLLSGEQAEKITKLFVEKVFDGKRLNGVSAHKGKIQGKCRVIVKYEKSVDIKEGDVLVTGMTDPRFVPIMEKTGAIITDAGGLLCHAAIVSREMKKPCIIGTKIATNILKDGDLVEVDADVGIVRILERGKKTVLTKLLHIDAPLLVAELTSIGENFKDIPWADKSFDIMPYSMYERRSGQIYYIYNQKGVDWKKEMAGRFDKEIMKKEILSFYEEVEDILKNERSLTRNEFSDFIKKIKAGWTWLDCMWWMIEYYDKYNMEMEDLLAVRKRTEYFAPGLIATVRNSVTAMVPDHAKYSDVLLLDEVLSGKVPSHDVLEKRMNGCVYKDGKIYESIEEVEKKFNIAIEKERSLTNEKGELMGQIAFEGCGKGKVRILKNRGDMKDFEDGDVIVASTTTPDYLPVMKKSAAIISEHGGAICHAAITSRELKIPCIVGVKGATQVLKDGDLVEVDADEGVVRILEKSDKEDNGKDDRGSVEQELKPSYTLGNQDVDASFLTLEMTWRGMEVSEVERHIGLPTPFSFAEIVDDSTINYYVQLEKFTEFSHACADALMCDMDLRTFLEEKTVNAAREIREFSKAHIDQLDSLSRQEIADVVENIMKLQSTCVTYGVVVAYADLFGQVSDEVMEIINKRDNLMYPKHVYSNELANPEEKSLTEEAYADIRKSKRATEDLAKEYYWLEQGYIGRGVTQKFIKEIQDEHHREDVYDKKELLKELNLNDDELNVVRLSQTLIRSKSLRADSRQFAHVLINKIVDRLAEECGVAVGDLEILSTEEMIAFICESRLPENIAKRRVHAVVPSAPDGNYAFIVDEGKVQEYIDTRVIKEEISDNREIEGQVAQPGKVRGRARLVFGPQHNAKVQKGDILISRATSPQLLPAMKKSAAFVTDIGGITSHAAIVSRELKIPCIIGTKIATQVLKDGDLVEVDADNGVVKILK